MNLAGAFFFGFCVSMLISAVAALCQGRWGLAGGILLFEAGVVVACALCTTAGRPRE